MVETTEEARSLLFGAITGAALFHGVTVAFTPRLYRQHGVGLTHASSVLMSGVGFVGLSSLLLAQEQ